MVECPDCKSKSVQSKGYRTKGVHRYLCNECGRNFTVDQRVKESPVKPKENEIMTDSELAYEDAKRSKQIADLKQIYAKEKPKMTNIAVSVEIREWLGSLKIIPAESLNDVLIRIKEKRT